MIPGFHNIAILHNKNQIRIPNRRQTVCNYKACTVLHQLLHALLNQYLRTGIDRGGCLIQNEHLGICKEGTRNGQQLFLSLRDIIGFLINHRIIAMIQRTNEMIDIGSICRSHDFLIGSIQAAIAQILHDSSVEQPRILQHHTEQ